MLPRLWHRLSKSNMTTLVPTHLKLVRKYSEEEACRNTVKLTWINYLYDTSESKDANLSNLRKRLQVAVSSKRSHEKGDLLPYLVAKELLQFYSSLNEKEEQVTFFKLMSEHLGVQTADVNSSIQKYQTSLERDSNLTQRYQKELANSLVPSYKHLFDDITKLENGLPFLVRMRKDLITLYRSKSIKKTASVLAFDSCLKEHLAQWFTGGFLDLHRITWEHSSAGLLEKIRSYEAVHKINDWNELKRRLRPGRRVFSFTHRLMPGEPLVILHTSLGRHISWRIQDVLDDADASEENVMSACFYSISSTQRGLDGIGLGNLLIKRAVEYLRSEFNEISTFATLSPVPGFRKWLDGQLSAIDTNVNLPRHLCEVDKSISFWRKLKKVFSDESWYKNEDHIRLLEEPLTKLCLRYLVHEKQRGFAIDSVAHFHLRNGASLWRINFLGNSNDYGMNASYGFMVNYKYDLHEIEANNNNYVMRGDISISSDIQSLLEMKSKL